jgi:hypothetical protein
MQLSKSFTLNELTKSQEATRLGIDNIPNEEHIENLKILCEKNTTTIKRLLWYASIYIFRI